MRVKFMCIEYIIANALIYAFEKTNGKKQFITTDDVDNIIYKLKNYYEDKYSQKLVIINLISIEHEISNASDYMKYDRVYKRFYFIEDLYKLKERFKCPSSIAYEFNSCLNVIDLEYNNEVPKSESYIKWGTEEFIDYCFKYNVKEDNKEN